MCNIRASVSTPPAAVQSTLPNQMWLEAFQQHLRSASAALYWTLLATHHIYPAEARTVHMLFISQLLVNIKQVLLKQM